MDLKLLSRFAALCALLLCATTAHAQFLGYTSPQTVNVPVFAANTSCATGSLISAPITNVGQSVHVISYNFGNSTGNLNGVVARIFASTDNVNYFQISDDGMPQAATPSLLVGYGSYPFVKVYVIGGSTGCLVKVDYSGTSVSPPNSVGITDQTAYQKSLASAQSAGSNGVFQNLVTPYGNTSGVIVVQNAAISGGGGPPAGSTITITASYSLLLAPSIATFALDTTAAVQSFVVPPYPTSGYKVTYTSGGASSNILSINYIFAKPGEPTAPLCEKTAIINTAAAGPTQIIAAVAGQSVRICSISVSSGTAEAIDFQQGQGTNCATGNAQLTGLYHAAANGIVSQNFPGGALVSLPSAATCVHLSGTNQTDGTITYSQY